MTITQERPALWSAMPGWGIAADLTPKELINARQLKVLRKVMAAGIVTLLIVGAGGYLPGRSRELQRVGRPRYGRGPDDQLQGVGQGLQ